MAGAVQLSEQDLAAVSYVGVICAEPDSLLRQTCSSALQRAGAHLPFPSALACAVSCLLQGWLCFVFNVTVLGWVSPECQDTADTSALSLFCDLSG